MARTAALLSITEDTEEMSALLDTLDIEVLRTIIQKRSTPHRTSYLGPGRISDADEELKRVDVDLVIINGILKPSQHHELEMLFRKECVDRIGVILRIFAEHAHTAEAKMQVTLATLRYELPFLREWIHKAKSGERPGFLSGGAYATEVYYEHARSHIRRIEKELQSRSVQRELRRKRRRSEGYFLVSLAGYTNAGKSALLNALCDTEVEVDGRLFSTLSTTTRRLKGSSRNVLLTDTVGFIRDLPPDLINAFNSTLEEIFLADMILVVVDLSESRELMKKKLQTSMAILTPHLQGQTMLVVGNKVDKITGSDKEQMEGVLKKEAKDFGLLFTSASTREGLDHLINVIGLTAGRTCSVEAALPLTDDAFSLLSALHDIADVEQRVTTDEMLISILCSEGDRPKIEARISAVGGRMTTAEPPIEDGPLR